MKDFLILLFTLDNYNAKIYFESREENGRVEIMVHFFNILPRAYANIAAGVRIKPKVTCRNWIVEKINHLNIKNSILHTS